MPRIVVEGKAVDVKGGKNLLAACLDLGFDVPYFCWHPALGSVGACRQCAVKIYKDEHDERGQIVMSCMTPVVGGMRVAIDDPGARAFRSSVIEWLMTNHPHDCPVCDEGGQCHLQDMTVMTGHVVREFRFPKRTYRNQDLGPCLHHEMNRCIQCYRCVRFYRDYSGGRDLAALGSRDRVYFGREASGTLDSDFSGNLAEICPTGVFTDKTARRHSARKWDLTTAPSVCVHCGVGCNTIPSQRYGELVKIENRYHHEINGYALCDRGRYGGRFVESERRIRRAVVRDRATGESRAVNADDALALARSLLAKGRAIGIGSPRASLEANFVLKGLVGADRFFLGIADAEREAVLAGIAAMKDGPARIASVREIEEADAALVLEDVAETAPRIALALRQAVRQRQIALAESLGIPRWHDQAVRGLERTERNPLVVAATHPTRLDEIASDVHRAAPDDLARFGFAVARAIEGGPSDGLAGKTARDLLSAERPTVIAGTTAGAATVRAAFAIARALCRAGKDARAAFVAPECNTVGLALLGGRPLSDASAPGGPVVAIVLENDLTRRASPSDVEALLARCAAVIAVDVVETPTTARADLVLPAATFAEGDGTFVNHEGRAQRFFACFEPDGHVRESWRWIDALRDGGPRYADLDAVLADLAATETALAGAKDAAPSAAFRLLGRKVPRQPHRFSGRTSIRANLDVSEPAPPDDPDAPLGFSMEGHAGGAPPPALLSAVWTPQWNSPQALGRFQQETGGPLRGGDPGVRLIAPGNGSTAIADDVPPAFVPKAGALLIVARPAVFGSDELSMLEPAVTNRAATPRAWLHPADAAPGLAAGDDVDVVLDGGVIRVALEIDDRIPRGVAALSPSFPETAIPLPAWGVVRRSHRA
jgi:NADH-quinone oxidoreductase subunit G